MLKFVQEYMQRWKMIQFKSCPRCRGDMKITEDMYGKYKECLQCGNMLDIEEQTPQRIRRFTAELHDKEVA